MITSDQIRMARAGLGWTIEELSKKSSVSSRTIKRIENAGDFMSAHMSTILKIQHCFETAGIEFIGKPYDRPGVCLGMIKPTPARHSPKLDQSPAAIVDTGNRK